MGCRLPDAISRYQPLSALIGPYRPIWDPEPLFSSSAISRYQPLSALIGRIRIWRKLEHLLQKQEQQIHAKTNANSFPKIPFEFIAVKQIAVKHAKSNQSVPPWGARLGDPNGRSWSGGLGWSWSSGQGRAGQRRGLGAVLSAGPGQGPGPGPTQVVIFGEN